MSGYFVAEVSVSVGICEYVHGCWRFNLCLHVICGKCFEQIAEKLCINHPSTDDYDYDDDTIHCFTRRKYRRREMEVQVSDRCYSRVSHSTDQKDRSSESKI